MNTLDLGNKLELEEFCQYMKEHFFDDDPALADKALIRIDHVNKNNGVVLTGITIMMEDENIAPTIYLNDMHNDYKDGKSLHNCLDRLRYDYRTNRIEESINISFFEDFSTVKGMLHPRIINTAMNQNMLEEMPHFEYGDLTIGFYADVKADTLGARGSIRVLNAHLAMWEVTPKELLEAAIENEMNGMSYEIKTMEQIIGDMVGEEVSDLFMEGVRGDRGMYVLKKNGSDEHFGATGMIYPDLLEEHAKNINDSFYIIPSSLHELILISANSRICPGVSEMREMVKEVNETQVDREDILAENIYFYDKEARALYRTDTGDVMHIVDNTPVIKLVVNPKDLAPKKESIKEKMEGYKAVVKNTEPSAKKTAPDHKKDSVRE